VCVCVRVSKEKKITGKKITFNNPWQTVGDALWEENNTHNLIKPEQRYSLTCSNCTCMTKDNNNSLLK